MVVVVMRAGGRIRKSRYRGYNFNQMLIRCLYDEDLIRVMGTVDAKANTETGG